MPKKPKAPLLPREPITAEGETFAEAETRHDLRFKSEFSKDEMEKGWDEFSKLVASKGWQFIDGEYRRKGTPLGAMDAFEKDSTCFAARNAYDLRQQLRKFVIVAPPEQLRALRIACEAGASQAEYLTAKRAEGRRESTTPEIVEAAVQRFLATPGNARSKPTKGAIGKPRYWTHTSPLTWQQWKKWKDWRKASRAPSD